jgi:hypothetical protein
MTLPNPPVPVQSYVADGLEFGTISEIVDLSTAAANFAFGTVPKGACVVAVALTVPATISATTAVKIGVGRLTSTADPDKYYLTSALTAGEFSTTLAWTAGLAADESVGIFACDTNGAAAGSIGGAGQYVQARIVYAKAKALPTL